MIYNVCGDSFIEPNQRVAIINDLNVDFLQDQIIYKYLLFIVIS